MQMPIHMPIRNFFYCSNHSSPKIEQKMGGGEGEGGGVCERHAQILFFLTMKMTSNCNETWHADGKYQDTSLK